MKFFLIIILFAIIVLLAVIIYLRYQYRYRFFCDMIYVTKQLKNNISFSKDVINKLLIDAYKNTNKSSQFLINNLDGLSSKLILKNGRKIVLDFYSSLGRGDIDYEINNLNYYESQFECIANDSLNEQNNKGTMYFKLIIGIGLILCVLLL